MHKKCVTKNALLFLSRAPTYHSFSFNSRFSYELKHKVRLSKSMHCIFHFRFRFVNFFFFFTKIIDSLALKHNSFQNRSNNEATHAFAS